MKKLKKRIEDKVKKAFIELEFSKIQNEMVKSHRNLLQFYKLCESYYGKENYGEHDEDEIIDSIDYGNGNLTFKRFDEIMKRINKS